MSKRWKKHIFTAELPYEKDAVVGKFLRDYFERVDDFIMSLGQMTDIPPSRLFTYVNGELKEERTFIKNNMNAAGFKLYFLLLPKAILSVTFDLIRALKSIDFRCDIFFAQHFLPAYVALLLRKVGLLKCKKIVYWSFDFFLIPPGFTRSLYYRGVDKVQGYLRKNADEVWYTTPRLEEVDRFRHGKLKDNSKVKITHGIFFKRFETKSPNNPPPIKLAFLGSLRVNNAVYESVDVADYSLKNELEVELHIIGSGPEEERLKKYVKKKGIEKNVIFYGYENRGKKIAEIFSECHLGLCLYPADPYGPNWYVTSGKFRRFISQRLPVITTTVPYLAKYIHEYDAGLIVDNNPKSVYEKLLKVKNNPKKLKGMRKGVDKLYEKYESEKVFKKAFNDLLK